MICSPLVSVVVPAYNAGIYLPQLCASLQAQTFRDFEVLILCDGGNDHLQPEMRPYFDDPRFNILSWKSNQGVTAATDFLLRRVRGEYWCYPGADDILLPLFIEKRLEIMKAHLDVSVIFGQGVQIDEHGIEVWYHPARVLAERLEQFHGQILSGERMVKLLLQDNIINTPSAFCRTGLTVFAITARKVVWRYSQDYYYWMLLAGKNLNFYYDHTVLHQYRMHAEQLSRRTDMNSVRLAEARLVPLCALADATKTSQTALVAWHRWRKPLYAGWLLRALNLKRKGDFECVWQTLASEAFHNRSRPDWTFGLDILKYLPDLLLRHHHEKRLQRTQIWVNGLRSVQDPVFDL